MPAKRTIRFLAPRSGTRLSCAAMTSALVGFQGVGNVRFMMRPQNLFSGSPMAAPRRKAVPTAVALFDVSHWQTICSIIGHGFTYCGFVSLKWVGLNYVVGRHTSLDNHVGLRTRIPHRGRPGAFASS